MYPTCPMIAPPTVGALSGAIKTKCSQPLSLAMPPGLVSQPVVPQSDAPLKVSPSGYLTNACSTEASGASASTEGPQRKTNRRRMKQREKRRNIRDGSLASASSQSVSVDRGDGAEEVELAADQIDTYTCQANETAVEHLDRSLSRLRQQFGVELADAIDQRGIPSTRPQPAGVPPPGFSLPSHSSTSQLVTRERGMPSVALPPSADNVPPPGLSHPSTSSTSQQSRWGAFSSTGETDLFVPDHLDSVPRGSVEVVDEAAVRQSEQASRAAASVRSLMEISQRMAWQRLWQEFEVQQLVWSSTLIIGSSGGWQYPSDMAQRPSGALEVELNHIRELAVTSPGAASQLLIDVLRKDSEGKNLLNNAVRAAADEICGAEWVGSKRQSLAALLDAHAQMRAGSVLGLWSVAQLEELVGVCVLGEAEKLVRRVIGLAPKVEDLPRARSEDVKAPQKTPQKTPQKAPQKTHMMKKNSGMLTVNHIPVIHSSSSCSGSSRRRARRKSRKGHRRSDSSNSLSSSSSRSTRSSRSNTWRRKAS